MYTEYEEKKGFPIRDFLIKLVLIIIFILLLVWLLPIPNMNGVNNKIFNANIQEMKDTAISYFTTERLPKNVGDKVKLSLQDMLDLKLLLPVTDKNGKTCNNEESFVMLEKKETEYVMTVHLKCEKEDAEIIVHLGCYSYCTSAICEKKEEVPEKVSGPSCVLAVSGTKGTNNWYVGNAKVSFKSKTTTGTAKIVEYGITTGAAQYNKATSYTVDKDGSTKVYGYVKDSDGKTAVCSVVVEKDTVKPSCELTILGGTKNSTGVYITDVKVGFKSKTDTTSGAIYYGLSTTNKADYNGLTNYTITKNGATTIYGFVKDKAGNTNTCNTTVTLAKTEKVVSTPTCALEVVSGTLGENGWYVSNVTVGFKSKGSTNGATIKNFGMGLSKTSGNNTTYPITSDGTSVVYGYVTDSNGYEGVCSLTIKKDVNKPTCEVTIKKGTLGSTGSYTDSVIVALSLKKDVTSGVATYGMGNSNAVNYNKLDEYSVLTKGRNTTYGYIKDNAGNTNDCSISYNIASVEYQYSKTMAKEYSVWSAWTTNNYDVNKAPTFGVSSDGLTENVDLGKVREVIRFDAGKAIYAYRNVLVDTVEETTCSGYAYYRYQDNTTKTYAVKVAEDWEYLGMVKYAAGSVPEDTMAVRYEYVKEDWDTCSGECTTAPYTLWKKYSRTVSTVTATDTITSSTGVTTKCSSYVTTSTSYYSKVRQLVSTTVVRVYGDQYKYKTRTRTLVRGEYIDYKWSAVYNDATLYNLGYVMTGNKRYV